MNKDKIMLDTEIELNELHKENQNLQKSFFNYSTELKKMEMELKKLNALVGAMDDILKEALKLYQRIKENDNVNIPTAEEKRQKEIEEINKEIELESQKQKEKEIEKKTFCDKCGEEILLKEKPADKEGRILCPRCAL